MDYYIYDDVIRYNCGVRRGSFDKKELSFFIGEGGTEVSVAVVDTLQKVVLAPEDQADKRDETISRSFGEEYLIQYERIGLNMFQVMAIKKDVIKKIYDIFKNSRVDAVIPYAVALRGYLTREGVDVNNKCIVFLDYMGDQILLTLFDGLRFVSPRKISTSPVRMISEIKRSEQQFNMKFRKENERELGFFVLSNNKDLLEEIKTRGHHTKDEVGFVDGDYPAIEGMSSAKFDACFLLPEQVLKQKRLKEFKKNLVSIVLSASLIAIGVIFISVGATFNSSAKLSYKRVGAGKEIVLEKLKTLNAKKYRAVLLKETKVDFSLVYSSFLSNMPRGYSVDKLSLRKEASSWIFEALIYLDEKSEEIISFYKEDLFENCIVEDIVVNKRPGQRVVLNLTGDV